MLKLICVGSGSTGNCYLLYHGEDVLIIDCGLPFKEIKEGLMHNILGIKGVIVTHAHQDHSYSIKDFRRLHIPVFTPYEEANKKPSKVQIGDFTITAMPLLDKNMEHWQHTNGDGSECPCYAFLIEVDDQRILYVTDTKLLVWNLSKWQITHMLIGMNYIPESLSKEEFKTKHIVTGHMSLTAAKEIVNANLTDALDTVILCHLSKGITNRDKCIEEMSNVAKYVRIDVADKNKEWKLYGSKECPFY